MARTFFFLPNERKQRATKWRERGDLGVGFAPGYEGQDDGRAGQEESR